MEPTHVVERNFFLFLLDAFRLQQIAATAEDKASRGSFARASLLMSVIAMECCANICLAKASAGALRNDLDKLPFLSKFDFFVRTNSSTCLDRGRVECERVEELKSLRDAIVHPKPKQRQLRKVEAIANDGAREYNIIGSAGAQLGISNSPAYWSADDALKALDSSVAFLRYCFVEALGYKSIDVFALLASEINYDEGQRLPLEIETSQLLKAAQGAGIDLQFLIQDGWTHL